MAAANLTQILDTCAIAAAKMLFDSITTNKAGSAADQALGEKRAKRWQAEARAIALLRAAGPVAPAAEGSAAEEDDDAGEDGAVNDNEGTTVKDGHGFDLDSASDAELAAESVRRVARFRRELELCGLALDAASGRAAAGDEMLATPGAAGSAAADG